MIHKWLCYRTGRRFFGGFLEIVLDGREGTKYRNEHGWVHVN
ncbi:hypothetical protein Hanom_Chr08g00727691 [Helianthus anomalus]